MEKGSISSSVFLERPVIASVCTRCLAKIRIGNADAYPLAFWKVVEGYKIQSIELIEGKSYEKVDSKFLHKCLQPVPQSAADSLRSV